MNPSSHASGRSRFESAFRLAISSRWSDAVHAVVAGLATSEAEQAHGDEAVEALAEIARIASEAGDLAAADEALVAALLVRPRRAALLERRAVIQLALGERGEARALFQRALEVDPAHAASRLELALLDAREGRLPEALAALRALGRATGAGGEGLRHGIEQLEQGDLGEAERELRSALEGAGAPPPGTVDDARADLESGRLDRAERRLDALIDARPGEAALHALRGRVEMERGAVDDAMASFGLALELEPDDHDTRLRLAQAIDRLGLRVQAIEQLELVLERSPAHAAARALHERWSARVRRSERANPASKRS